MKPCSVCKATAVVPNELLLRNASCMQSRNAACRSAGIPCPFSRLASSLATKPAEWCSS